LNVRFWPVAACQAKAQACQRIDLMSIFGLQCRWLQSANNGHCFIEWKLIFEF
jgi:hypothetical protein